MTLLVFLGKFWARLAQWQRFIDDKLLANRDIFAEYWLGAMNSTCH